MARISDGTKPLSSGAVLLVASILVLPATIGVAQAQGLCANIDSLIDHSRSHFGKIMDKPNGDAGDHDVTLTLAGASYCFVTKKPKRNLYHCGWEFPYRAKQAYDTYNAFDRDVNDCIGRQATVHSDRSVNHPDFYALRRYETEQADVSVSVKDKSALGHTFVFIRVQSRKSR